MPFSTTAYCTLAQVHSALNLITSVTADDAWITNDAIPQAQQFIDDYLGYSFQQDGTVSVPATRTYDGNDTTELFIDRCISLNQVLETSYSFILSSFGVGQSVQGPQIDITADMLLGPRFTVQARGYGFILRRISGLPFYGATSNYGVKGVFGSATVPLTITRACTRLVIHYYKMRAAAYAQGTAISQFGAMRYDQGTPIDVMQDLEPYRRRGFYAS